MASTIAPALLALAVALSLTACGGGISEPWVPASEKHLYDQERTRAPAVAQQLDHRLRYTQVDR